MRKRFHVTYDIVTPESAEHGDIEEGGFVLPGGWLQELPPDVCGDAAGVVKDECALSLREAIDLVSGCFDCGSNGYSYYEADGRQDYQSGAEQRRALHLPDNATPSSIKRIARVLGYRR